MLQISIDRNDNSIQFPQQLSQQLPQGPSAASAVSQTTGDGSAQPSAFAAEAIRSAGRLLVVDENWW